MYLCICVCVYGVSNIHAILELDWPSKKDSHPAELNFRASYQCMVLLIISNNTFMFYSSCRTKRTWLEGPGEAKGEGHGPSCNEKCAINTISFAKAPLTSALGHSKRYSEKRFETLKRTLCANQKRTFLLWRRSMHKASYLKQKYYMNSITTFFKKIDSYVSRLTAQL